MMGKLGFSINKEFKILSEIDIKQVYLPYHILLLSILKDAVNITDEKYIVTYWNIYSERSCGMNTPKLFDEYLQKIFKTNYLRIINLVIIKEPIRRRSYQNDLIQSTKKELLFYIKKVNQEIKENLNKLNLSNSVTIKNNKFIFTIRSDSIYES
jgi:hypothetical protein